MLIRRRFRIWISKEFLPVNEVRRAYYHKWEERIFISSGIELISNAIRVSVSSFFVNYWQDKILTPLGSFPQQFVLSPTFPDKTFLSPSFATGKKKNHFPRIFTLKPVTSLHTNILMHSGALQGQPAKGRSGCCRGVNHFNPNIKAKEKINH